MPKEGKEDKLVLITIYSRLLMSRTTFISFVYSFQILYIISIVIINDIMILSKHVRDYCFYNYNMKYSVKTFSVVSCVFAIKYIKCH